jgi:hypothetical protein
MSFALPRRRWVARQKLQAGRRFCRGIAGRRRAPKGFHGAFARPLGDIFACKHSLRHNLACGRGRLKLVRKPGHFPRAIAPHGVHATLARSKNREKAAFCGGLGPPKRPIAPYQNGPDRRKLFN